MLFYILGILFTWVVLTQESVNRAETQIQNILAVCVSLVWPLYAVGLMFYYKDEIAYSVAIMLNYAYDPYAEDALDTMIQMENDLDDIPPRG